MHRKQVAVMLVAATAVAVIVIIAFVLWGGTSCNGEDPTECREARDSGLIYMFAKYEIPFENPVYGSWTAQYTTPQGLVGSSTWEYVQGDWDVTVSYPVVPDPIYTVVIDYVPSGMGIPYHLYWEGTYYDGTASMFTITETDFWLAE